jgi:predicted GIY-YIG superfamily endonuclease
MSGPTARTGVIYLLHFERRYQHAAHYMGWAADLEQRLAEHTAGHGARLLAVVKAAGITWTLSRTWTGTRSDERALKRQGGRLPALPGLRCDATSRPARIDRRFERGVDR